MFVSLKKWVGVQNEEGVWSSLISQSKIEWQILIDSSVQINRWVDNFDCETLKLNESF